MSEIRIIHAADVHLGRPFVGLERSNPELGRLCQRASYAAWEGIVSAAIELKVNMVALAGDVFDGPIPGVRSQVAFREGVDRLYQSGIPVFMSLGNHDPQSHFPRSLQSLPGVHVFGQDPEGIHANHVETTEGVMVYGASFRKSATMENIVSRFRRDPGTQVAIGVVHANVSGIGGHKDYAPCTLDDLRVAGMDVWCLGHVHAPSVLWQDPLALYSGASQGAHVKESGPLGCFLVTVTDRGQASSDFISIAPVLWQTVDLDLDPADGVNELLDKAREACTNLLVSSGSPQALVTRIHLRGCESAELRRALNADNEMIETLGDYLTALPVPVFLESVLDLTRPALDPDSLMEDRGFLGEFVRLRRRIEQDSGQLAELVRELQKDLVKKVGMSCLTDGAETLRLIEERRGMTKFLDEATDLVFQIFGEIDGVDTRDLH
jgi:DNA repair protein SbcD/Mre11